MIVRLNPERKLHLALTLAELRTLGEALRWASTECVEIGRAHV